MSSILVNTAVLHLSTEERKQAMSMLLLLGLSKYTANTNSQLVDLAALQRLHAKSLVEIGNRPGKFPNKYDKTGTRPKTAPSSSAAAAATATGDSPPASPTVKAAVPSRTKSSGSGRSPRLNATEVYPFQDSDFNAEDVISGNVEAPPSPSRSSAAAAPASPSQRAPSFMAQSPAVRKRLAARAFADYSQGSAALRMSDVPMAMAALGLAVSPDLQDALLARARVPPGSSHKGPGEYPTPDPTVQLSQWQSLVEKYVDQDKGRKIAAYNEAVAQRVRAKVDKLSRNAAAASAVEGTTAASRQTGSDGAALVEALLSIEAIDGTSPLEEADTMLASTAGVRDVHDTKFTDSAADDDEAADEAAEDAVYKALGRGIVEARNRLSKMSPDQRRTVVTGRHTTRVSSSAGVTPATKTRWDRTLSSHIGAPVNASASKSTRLKNVPSKIASQVASDRRNFKYNQGQYSDAALKSVAHSKVEAVMGGRGKRGSAAPEDTDLTSGSSAMHIADAFLRGPVGQSLAQMEQEQQSDSLSLQHQEFLNRSLGEGGGNMQQAIDEADFLLSAGDHSLRVPATLSADELRFNAASEAAKQQREDNVARRKARGAVETQPELPSGWELKNGGFVADFATAKR